MIDSRKLKKIVQLSSHAQRLYLEQHFPFDQLAVENQVRIMRQKLDRGGREFGAGYVCYSESYTTDP
jgi:glucose-6-phosphate isomerase